LLSAHASGVSTIELDTIQIEEVAVNLDAIEILQEIPAEKILQ